MAFLYNGYDFLKLLINLIWFTFCFNHAIHWILLANYAVYISLIYMNLKFVDILHSLRVRIRWNNGQGLMAAMVDYHKEIQLIHSLSEAYNIILGYIYLIAPYIMVLELKLLLISDKPLYISIYFVVLFIFFIAVIYMFNMLCASVTTKNRNAPRQLYRVFCSYKFINFQHRLKILGLLEKLNYDFVGFYCLNLFKFTKMLFYQYLFNIASAYMLVTKLLR